MSPMTLYPTPGYPKLLTYAYSQGFLASLLAVAGDRPWPLSLVNLYNTTGFSSNLSPSASRLLTPWFLPQPKSTATFLHQITQLWFKSVTNFCCCLFYFFIALSLRTLSYLLVQSYPVSSLLYVAGRFRSTTMSQTRLQAIPSYLLLQIFATCWRFSQQCDTVLVRHQVFYLDVSEDFHLFHFRQSICKSKIFISQSDRLCNTTGSARIFSSSASRLLTLLVLITTRIYCYFSAAPNHPTFAADSLIFSSFYPFELYNLYLFTTFDGFL
jgi:hypothetical protein